MIMPKSSADLEEWFSRYRSFTRKWARIAEREEIDVLAVASELNTLTNTLEVDEVHDLEEYWSNSEKVEIEDRKVLDHQVAIEKRHLWLPGDEHYDSLDTLLEDKAAEHRNWARGLAFLDAADPVAQINERRRRLRGHWSKVIAEAREEFSGPLTYAAKLRSIPHGRLLGRARSDGNQCVLPTSPPAGSDETADRSRADSRGPMDDDSGIDTLVSTGAGSVPEGPVYRIGLRQSSQLDHRTPWAASGFSVLPSESGTELMIWEDQPTDRTERAAAVAGLYRANLALGGELLAGILYWKLSTEPAHEEVEPFVLIIGDRGPDDPLLEELQRFQYRRPVDDWLRRLGRILGLQVWIPQNTGIGLS